MRLNDDSKTVAAADCLVPGIGEIIEWLTARDRLELLEKRIVELGMNLDDYKCWILSVTALTHSGFGLG